jgi:hypothetical protein
MWRMEWIVLFLSYSALFTATVRCQSGGELKPYFENAVVV